MVPASTRPTLIQANPRPVYAAPAYAPSPTAVRAKGDIPITYHGLSPSPSATV